MTTDEERLLWDFERAFRKLEAQNKTITTMNWKFAVFLIGIFLLPMVLVVLVVLK